VQEQASSGHMATIIRIRCIFCTTIRPNTNTLFGLLFGPNRIRIEYSVQPYKQVHSFYCVMLCIAQLCYCKLSVCPFVILMYADHSFEFLENNYTKISLWSSLPGSNEAPTGSAQAAASDIHWQVPTNMAGICRDWLTNQNTD